MDYSKILYNQESIVIKTKDLNECLKSKPKLKSIVSRKDKSKKESELQQKYAKALIKEIFKSYNEDLYNFLEKLNKGEDFIFDYYNHCSIIVSKIGIYFGLKPIKNVVLDQYGLPDNKEVLETIYNSINADNLLSILDYLPGVDEYYFEYFMNKQNKYLNNKSNVSVEEMYKRIKESFCEVMKWRIQTALEFLDQEKQMSRIDPKEVSKRRLHYVLAKHIAAKHDEINRLLASDKQFSKEVREYWEEEKEKCFKYLLRYVKEYSNDESTQELKRALIVELKKRKEQKEELKKEESRRVETKPLPVLMDSKMIVRDTYNYNFFDFESVNKKELFSRIKEVASKYPNSEELNEILERKIKLYESLDYVSVKIGANSFDGYIGFELSNGYVVLDTLFEDFKHGKISYGNAIYVVRKDDFNKITTMSKTDAIELIKKGQIDAERIVHKENYEAKVYRYINNKGNK